MKYLDQVVATLINAEAHTATKYVSDKLVVRATRRMFGRRIRKRDNIELVLTVGRPNYSERKFIEDARRAGEKFPVKRILLKYPPKKRAA